MNIDSSKQQNQVISNAINVIAKDEIWLSDDVGYWLAWMKAWSKLCATRVWSGVPDIKTTPSLSPGQGSWTSTFAPEIWFCTTTHKFIPKKTDNLGSSLLQYRMLRAQSVFSSVRDNYLFETSKVAAIFAVNRAKNIFRNYNLYTCTFHNSRFLTAV